jgi:hypothetical protein
LDRLCFGDLAKCFGDSIKDKRLFLSACQVVNRDFAKIIMEECNPLSIIGPRTNVAFDDADLLWSSIYSKMFTINPKAMSSADLLETAAAAAGYFEVPMMYYLRDRKRPSGFRSNAFGPKHN